MSQTSWGMRMPFRAAIGVAIDGVLILVALAVTGLVASVFLGMVGPVGMIAAQGVLPFVGLAAPVVLVVALLRRRPTVAVVALVATLSFVAALAAPARGVDPPSWAQDADSFTLFQANLRHDNVDPAEAARAVLAADADVLVLNEVTPEFRAAFFGAGGGDAYSAEIHTSDKHQYGDMILSRLDASDVSIEEHGAFVAPSLSVTVGGTPIRIYATHLESPDDRPSRFLWVDQFADVGEMLSSRDGQAILAGDFNATPFHPPLRTLLSSGLTDAHRATGHGLRPSWAPPFVPSFLAGRAMRLDHSLSTAGVVPTAVTDAEMPGSDHRSMSVTYVVKP